MTKELTYQLTTGDWVKNTKTNLIYMIAVISPNIPTIITVESLTPVEDWELEKSRLTVTPEEWAKIKKYHEDIKKQMEKQK